MCWNLLGSPSVSEAFGKKKDVGVGVYSDEKGGCNGAVMGSVKCSCEGDLPLYGRRTFDEIIVGRLSCRRLERKGG